jgi:hypothetical protein
MLQERGHNRGHPSAVFAEQVKIFAGDLSRFLWHAFSLKKPGERKQYNTIIFQMQINCNKQMRSCEGSAVCVRLAAMDEKMRFLILPLFPTPIRSSSDSARTSLFFPTGNNSSIPRHVPFWLKNSIVLPPVLKICTLFDTNGACEGAGKTWSLGAAICHRASFLPATNLYRALFFLLCRFYPNIRSTPSPQSDPMIAWLLNGFKMATPRHSHRARKCNVIRERRLWSHRTEMPDLLLLIMRSCAFIPIEKEYGA